MKETKKSKVYKALQFQLVRPEESNVVFIATSGTPGEPIPTGGINSMNRGTSTSW